MSEDYEQLDVVQGLVLGEEDHEMNEEETESGRKFLDDSEVDEDGSLYCLQQIENELQNNLQIPTPSTESISNSPIEGPLSLWNMIPQNLQRISYKLTESRQVTKAGDFLFILLKNSNQTFVMNAKSHFSKTGETAIVGETQSSPSNLFIMLRTFSKVRGSAIRKDIVDKVVPQYAQNDMGIISILGCTASSLYSTVGIQQLMETVKSKVSLKYPNWIGEDTNIDFEEYFSDKQRGEVTKYDRDLTRTFALHYKLDSIHLTTVYPSLPLYLAKALGDPNLTTEIEGIEIKNNCIIKHARNGHLLMRQPNLKRKIADAVSFSDDKKQDFLDRVPNGKILSSVLNDISKKWFHPNTQGYSPYYLPCNFDEQVAHIYRWLIRNQIDPAYLAYCITECYIGRQINSRVLIFHGPHETGKSTLIRSIYKSFPFAKHLNIYGKISKFAFAEMMIGSKLVIVDNVVLSGISKRTHYYFRSISNGSVISVKAKYRNPIQMRAPSMIMTTNEDVTKFKDIFTNGMKAFHFFDGITIEEAEALSDPDVFDQFLLRSLSSDLSLQVLGEGLSKREQELGRIYNEFDDPNFVKWCHRALEEQRKIYRVTDKAIYQEQNNLVVQDKRFSRFLVETDNLHPIKLKVGAELKDISTVSLLDSTKARSPLKHAFR